MVQDKTNKITTKNNHT